MTPQQRLNRRFDAIVATALRIALLGYIIVSYSA